MIYPSWPVVPAGDQRQETTPTATTPTPTPTPRWMYHVHPCHELPLLDLSISLKTRFLSPVAQKRFNRWMRLRGVMSLGYLLTSVLFTVVLLAPPRIGQVLGVVGFISGLPGTIFTASVIRYDVIKVLLLTYDVIFFEFVVFSTLIVLMAMLNDARMAIFMLTLVANQFNVLLDANIQAVRSIVIMNGCATISSVFVILLMALDIVPGLHNFAVFQYGSHRLGARGFFINAGVTLFVLMLRSVYRKRAILFDKSSTSDAVVECVSYRCSLMLSTTVEFENQHRAYTPTPPDAQPLPPQFQRMRYVACLPTIEASRTLAPVAFRWLVHSTDPVHAHAKQLAVGGLGYAAWAATMAVGVYARIFNTMLDAVSPVTAQEDALLMFAFASTLLYTMTCFALSQRQLLVSLGSSFDFVFLSSQLTFMHFAEADFFRWRKRCLLLAVAWLWAHWVLCTDTLTPIVRDRIGLTQSFIKFVMAGLILSMVGLTYLLIFRDSSVDIYDRVVWSGRVLNHNIEFRVMPSFYSCYATVLSWSLRILWRVFHSKRNQMVMIDGPVAYDNYFHSRSTASTPAPARTK